MARLIWVAWDIKKKSTKYLVFSMQITDPAVFRRDFFLRHRMVPTPTARQTTDYKLVFFARWPAPIAFSISPLQGFRSKELTLPGKRTRTTSYKLVFFARWPAPIAFSISPLQGFRSKELTMPGKQTRTTSYKLVFFARWAAPSLFFISPLQGFRSKELTMPGNEPRTADYKLRNFPLF
jgi:hypothetical protein